MKRNWAFLLPVFFCMMLWISVTARAEDGITVDENHFPDPVFRQWILDEKNLNGAGADGVLTAEEIHVSNRESLPWRGLGPLLTWRGSIAQ